MRRLFDYIEQILAGVFQKIDSSCNCDPSGLAYVRILSGIFFLAVYPPRWQWIGEIPDSLFHPPILSLANLISRFPSTSFLFTTELLATLSLFFVTLGYRTRISALLAALLYILNLNFVYSFGKIDHSIMLPVTLLCLAFTNAGHTLALRKDRFIDPKIERLSLSFFGVCIAFGMFSAGFAKFIWWLDFDLTSSGFLSWYYPNYYMYCKQDLLASWIPAIPQASIEIAEYMVVFLEISGMIWIVVSERTWKYWLFGLCIFHLATHLTLNIAFTGHVIVYGIFLLSPIGRVKLSWRKRTKQMLLYVFGGVSLGVILLRLCEVFVGKVLLDFQGISIYGPLLLWGTMISVSFVLLFRHQNTLKAVK